MRCSASICRRWGVPLIDGGTVRLPRLIGQSRALDMILTGRPVAAMEAFAMGLANRVVPKGESRAEAEKLAAEPRALSTDLPEKRQVIRLRTIRFRFRRRDGERVQARRGHAATGESLQGAARFASGKGRGGVSRIFSPVSGAGRRA